MSVTKVAFHAVAGPQGGPRTYAVALAEALHARDDVELIVLTDRVAVVVGAATNLTESKEQRCFSVNIWIEIL